MRADLKPLRFDSVRIGLAKSEIRCLEVLCRGLPGLVLVFLGQLPDLWDPLADVLASRILQVHEQMRDH